MFPIDQEDIDSIVDGCLLSDDDDNVVFFFADDDVGFVRLLIVETQE